MAQLIIERVLDSGFEFTLDGGVTVFDGFPNMTSFDNVCHFKTRNGANIIKNQNITAGEVTVLDTFGGTGSFNYTNVSSLRIKLNELNFFNGMGSEGSGGGVTRFDALLDAFNYFGNNGKVAVVDEAQQKLIATVFYNYNKLTQHDDVDISSLIENKVLGTEIIDGITKVTLIDKPKDGTTYFSAVGGFDYDDLATSTTPLVYTSGDLQLTNDTLGAYTFLSQPPFGITSVWNEDSNTFDFSQLSIGDEVFLRVHLNVTTTSSNQISGLKILFGEGTSNEYEQPIDLGIAFKTAGSHDVIRELKFYIGNNDWKNTPAKLLFNSDANASIVVYGWHPYIIRKSINILDVNDDNYKTFKISNIESNINDVTVNTTYLKLGYNPTTSKVNKIIVDLEYSKFIAKHDELSTSYNNFISLTNKTKNKTLSSKVVDFTLLDGYYFIDVEETTDYTDFSINDKVEILITSESIGSDSAPSSTPETFTYNGGAQTFTLSTTPNNIDLHIGRTWQYTNAHTLAGNEVTVLPTLRVGDKVTIRPYGTANAPEVFTATEGQTEFTLSAIYNNVDAYLGRVWQYPTSDYTLTGNLLTLTSPAKAGDILTVRPF